MVWIEGTENEQMNLSEEEKAFYDGLEVNDSAVKVLEEVVLREIARDLLISIRKNVSIDWTVKEYVQAKLRVMVKRILRHHNYPPDKQEKTVFTILKQAALFAEVLAV